MPRRPSLSLALVLLLAMAACRSRGAAIPPGSPDQSVADAMRLVCDAPARADADRSDASRSDRIAGHLTDGVGNVEVLTTVEGWKTDGIKKDELDKLLARAKLSDCKLREEAQ